MHIISPLLGGSFLNRLPIKFGTLLDLIYVFTFATFGGDWSGGQRRIVLLCYRALCDE